MLAFPSLGLRLKTAVSFIIDLTGAGKECLSPSPASLCSFRTRSVRLPRGSPHFVKQCSVASHTPSKLCSVGSKTPNSLHSVLKSASKARTVQTKSCRYVSRPSAPSSQTSLTSGLNGAAVGKGRPRQRLFGKKPNPHAPGSSEPHILGTHRLAFSFGLADATSLEHQPVHRI